jgi:amidase
MSAAFNDTPCEITKLSATELSKAIHSKAYSCVEVMQAYLKRIKAINPSYNAIISMRSESDLMTDAKVHDDLLAAGTSKGWLHGIPQAIKDLSQTAGLTTTMGSPLMANNIPQEDGLMVARMKEAGAIIIGKTNVPEFGLGSHTFNSVFGATKNAFDITKTAGGSSGGAAVALAQHLLPVADGSDFMGSLRNPAGWNNVFGMRPSQGRVPMWPANEVWLAGLGTEGPMARNVEDLARLLSTQAGFDVRCPTSQNHYFDLALALKPLETQQIKQLNILWLGDLCGYLPLEDGIDAVCSHALQALAIKGCKVDVLQSHTQLGFQPDAIWNAWLVWRQLLVGARLAPFMAMKNGRERIKPEALYEYDSSLGLTANHFMKAGVVRSSFYQAMSNLLSKYDALALPSAQVWPFDVNTRHPTEIKTTKRTVAMDTYHRWMESSIYATFAGLPAISVPAGFGSNGLAMGLQLIGAPQGDADLLRLAALF